MPFRLRYIEPMYGFDADIRHIAVGESADAQRTLETMGEELPGTDDLVAIYIPEGTDEAYMPGNLRGRVVGAVRLLPMPPGKTIKDYYHRDIDGSLRWPVGWPCEAVLAPPVDECRYLRGVIEDLFGRGTFAPYVNRFQRGPFKLEQKVANTLLASLMRFPPLR